MSIKKIKILLVVRWPVGGIRTYIRYVYSKFNIEKYELTVIAPDVSETNILLDDLCKYTVRYIPVGTNPRVIDIVKSVSNELGKYSYDIIHSHGLTAGLCSIFGSKIYGVPHLVTIHDVFVSGQFDGKLGFLKKTAISILLPLVNVIHTVSNDAKDNLINYLPVLRYFRKKIIPILNGIEIERFKQVEKRNLREQLNIDSNTFLIGFLGRFMRQKGFVYLIDAIDVLVKEYKINKKPVIIAFGGGAFIREEMITVQQKGLNNRVYFMPFEPNIAPILKGLDVVVMPSLWEACGLLAMESMVVGTPLITTNCIGLREVVCDTPCRTVSVMNSKELAQAIYDEMVESSKVIFEKYSTEAARRFDVVHHSNKIENIINNLIKG